MSQTITEELYSCPNCHKSLKTAENKQSCPYCEQVLTKCNFIWGRLTSEPQFRPKDSGGKERVNCRSESIGTAQIQKLNHSLEAPDCVGQTAIELYDRAASKSQLGKRGKRTTAAACFFYCTKDNGTPRTLKQIAATDSRLERGEIGREYRLLCTTLDLTVPPQTSTDFVSQISQSLGVSESVRTNALTLTKAIEQSGEMSGRDPCGLAASAVYIASRRAGIEITQQQVGDIASVTERTVSSNCKLITEKFSQTRASTPP